MTKNIGELTTITALQNGDYIHAFRPTDPSTSQDKKILVENALPGIITLPFILGNGLTVIPTGIAGDMPPYMANLTFVGWSLLATKPLATPGSLVVDLWLDTYANFHPTVADSITGTEKPTLASATKNQDLSLTSWTVDYVAGGIIRVNVDSASVLTQATLGIHAVKA